jgi:hypothetical protein
MRVLIRWLGDWAYAIAISLGWQPREERDKPEGEPGQM